MLCLINSLACKFTPRSARAFNSISAALPLYSLKWLQAFRETAIAESGYAYVFRERNYMCKGDAAVHVTCK
jgi:hypothetical protein